MIRLLASSVLATLLLWQLPIDAVQAGQVYRWVDGDGETHFSDSPPTQDPGGATILQMRPMGAASGGDDFYSVVNQLQRMQQRRLAAQRERREVRAEARERQYDRTYGWRAWYYQPYFSHRRWGYTSAGYWFPHRRWHPRPGHGPRPHPLPTAPPHSVANPQSRVSMDSRSFRH